jgi:hypothetical protein
MLVDTMAGLTDRITDERPNRYDDETKFYLGKIDEQRPQHGTGHGG